MASLGLGFATKATARTALQRAWETDYAVIFLTGTNDDTACEKKGYGLLAYPFEFKPLITF